MAKLNKNNKPNTVLGQITDLKNQPLANLIVKVYDMDMRSEELLAETVTDRMGKYKIIWLHSQLEERERKSADILVKVFTREKETELYKSSIEEVRFNASNREEINIVIKNEIKPEFVEFDYISKEVAFLANDVPIAELQESKKHRDITFLTKETGIDSKKIEYLILSERIEQLSKIDADFFYGLFRKNSLLKNDLANPLSARLEIGLNADLKILLFDAALLDEKTITKDLKSAVKEKIVASSVVKEIKSNLKLLQQFKKEAEAYYDKVQPQKIVDIMTRFVTEGKIQEVGELFNEHKNDINVFFEKITDESFFKNEKSAKDAKVNIALGKLVGFDNKIIPNIIKSKKINAAKDIKKLARLNKADWVKELSKKKYKIAKNSKDTKTVDLLASNVVRKMEKEFPTVAFVAQLEREDRAIFQNQKTITSFLSKHDSFDLTKDNIDLFLKKKKIKVKEKEAIKEELKSVQRIFKLVPNYSKTITLRENNIHSAHSIVSVGETRFVNEIAPRAGINTVEATEIYTRAVNANTAAMLIAGELQDTMRAMDIASIETSTLNKKLEAVSEDFPNLKSLFKLTDTCACEHCRSVYSPAAYLVEILQFLDSRSVTDLTVTPNVTTNIAKDVLFERRPDLGEIDLSCDNANTPVKYIDLVCELLEEVIAPDSGIDYVGDLSDGANAFQGVISANLLSTLEAAGLPVTDKALVYETEVSTGSADSLPHYLRDTKLVCKIENVGVNTYKVFRLRQTLSPADELAAAPEYVNAEAYNILGASEFAFKLPFDLNHTEASAYFNRFDISRADLMKDFQVNNLPANDAISTEKLGLTEKEKNIIVTPKATVADQQNYWNAPAQWDDPPIAGDVLDYMKRLDHFMEKTMLTYKEVDLLLTLKFIDASEQLFIKNLDLTCNSMNKEIANLDISTLDRIHRFLRLQKKTGWKFETLDQIITQSKLGNGLLDNKTISLAADLLRISENTGIKIELLIAFYGEIPHKILNEDADSPLYQNVFLNKAKNGIIDEGLLPENVDGSQLLANFIDSISVCLQMKQVDVEKLLPLLPDGNLSFSNLSYLFGASHLIKKLRLKVEEFVIHNELTNINFSDAPNQTLKFINAVEDFKKSPLKVAEVKFLLRHEAEIIPDVEEKIQQILETLQQEYQADFGINRSRFDANLSADEQKEILQNELARFVNLSEDDVKTFLSFIDREWASAANAKTLVDEKFADLFDTTDIKNKVDELEAAITKDQDIIDHQTALSDLKIAKDELNVATTPAEIAAANAAITAAEAQLLITLPKYNVASGKNLLEALLNSIAIYQLEQGKLTILEEVIATSFKADLEMVKVVLAFAELKQPAPGSVLISEILSSDTLIDTDVTNITPILPVITNVAFPDQFGAVKLLFKLLPLIESFEISNDQLQWYFENNLTLSWFEFDSIPYDAAHVNIDYNKFIAFIGMLDIAAKYQPVVNPVDAESPISFISIATMLLPISAISRDQFIDAAALLLGCERSIVDEIDAHLFPVFDIVNYTDVNNWVKLIDCSEYLRKLEVQIAQINEYIKPVLLASDVNILRSALKSRYDESTWLDTLKEIMDAIRPQKRDALVTYILATNPEMKDENYLFDYFLVDVEMEACMPSSRIVQAHGSIQLFVQRCLMGLEPQAAADVENDFNWEQWKWMRNYRVWEANRKVFLYPENWIEPELRDDKSFLFKEFEDELLQNELTEYSAETALVKYLEKLDNIAFLEVMATWYQSENKTMHVFARTKGGDPAMYYYRRFESERYWTPWEKVELDITGNKLLAFMRNNRMYLAWPVFSEVPDPNQGATLPDQNDNTEQEVDQPRRKLKIQLAISELANNIWQPKKISENGIQTPDVFTADYIDRNRYNMMYLEPTQQIMFFKSNIDNNKEYHEKNGIFNLTGCKGYPELVFQGVEPFPDFYPDFNDTWLRSQRYYEWNSVPGDDFSVRNGISIFGFYELLKKTPGNFRVTYPLQITYIDLLFMIYQYFIFLLLKGGFSDYIQYKFAFGSMLPYFKENSYQSYVIVPGFYGLKETETELVPVKKTASNILQLIEDVVALIVKYLAKYNEDPTQDLNLLLEELLEDEDYQKIIAEIKSYSGLKYGEQFKNMYHPLICSLKKTLYKDGISELMKRATQLRKTSFDFEDYYDPNEALVPKLLIRNPDGTNSLTFPIEDLDFSSDGSYSGYNWELFYHVPMLLATTLTKNQKFEESMKWFHYMFNPTGALSGNTPQKYWVTKPFYLNQEIDYINQRIDTLLYKIADPNTPERTELEFAISEWRNKPFKPDVIARFRPVAYQKALLMKYIDNLIEWGDNLFRQDTMESIAQATQMYILADKILGPKPRVIPSPIKPPYETYNQIERKLSSFGNALIDLENILPDLSVLPEGGAELPPPPITLSMLYFCIPQNGKMLEYWDRIGDRLFKIRHCQNIDGVERSLALFAPPIDPGMLVRAAAAGLDISSVIAGMNAPAPFYRFNTLSQKATELANEARGLGISLMAALEKKDAETMALLRSELELKTLNAIRDMKVLQITEAEEQITVLEKTKLVTQERQTYYTNIKKTIAEEDLNLDKLDQSVGLQIAAGSTYTLGAILALIPDFALGASGFGGSPHGAAKFGGSLLAHSTDAVGKGLGIGSTVTSFQANKASIKGGFERREEDWKLQKRIADKEIVNIDQQIVAAGIRRDIAQNDLENHDLQIENAKKTDDFMKSKFTNKELYNWMIGQISSVYFTAYKLSFDVAKKAERSYKFELGNDDSFISYGYWDGMKKGLQCADKLIHDIKRMEISYLDKNKREYEITKHISLAMLDPGSLVTLRATGVCDFDIPEALYDMDFAGQYFRRIKTVSISLPCISGPYTSVSAKMSLVNNRYRKNTNADNISGTGYIEDLGNDERFVYNVGAIQSIAASSSQNDSGMFELNFRDERYLPFEGTGAISSWRLELPTEVRQFNYDTISDVTIHVKYTSREGGSSLKNLANAALKEQLNIIEQDLGETGMHLALHLKHDLPNEWHLLKKNATIDLTIDKMRLPYMVQPFANTAIESVMFLARVKENPASYTVNVDAVPTNLARINDLKLCQGINSDIELDTAFALSVADTEIDNLEDLIMIVKFSF